MLNVYLNIFTMLLSLLFPQLRIFENQLYRNQKEEPLGLNKDLLAIRMASINPILDPWIYILLRKTVVLKLMEKIKCLFCKMGGRGRRGGRQFRCAEGHLCSSIVSQDSPSLMSHELREMVSTSQIFLYPTGRNTGRLGSFQAVAQDGPSPSALQISQGLQDVEGHQRGLSQSDIEDTAPDRPLKDPSMCLKDQALHVTFPDKTANMQEKCI